MQLLKSVEELLYELVTWMLFYPLTLWRCVRDPVGMMGYAERELADADTQQYDDALSPPILLLITLLLAHMVELRFGADTKAVLPEMLADERNLLLFRAVSFSVFPLFLALQTLRQRGAKLSRDRLRPAFYSQCYVAAPTILAIDIALIIGQHGTPPAIISAYIIFTVGLIWYLVTETRWFVSKGMKPIAAFVMSAWTIVLGFVAILLVAAVAVYGMAAWCRFAQINGSRPQPY